MIQLINNQLQSRVPERYGNLNKHKWLIFLLALLILSQISQVNGQSLIPAVKPNPLPVISRGVPSYSSAGVASRGNDASFATFWQTYSNHGLPQWLAYDLSGVPVNQRDQVIIIWLSESWSFYGQNVFRAPKEYTIDVHAAAGGTIPASDDSGWVTLISEDTSYYKSRQYLVSLVDGSTIYNWVRIYINDNNGTAGSISINMDIHDASQGCEDSWFFAGNSITNMSMAPFVDEDLNFAEIIHKALPEYLPAHENAGVGGWTSYDGAAHIPDWMIMFPGRFVTLNYGTNDGGHTSDQDFYNNFEVMILAVLNAGKVPIIPTIPWLPLDGAEENVIRLNGILAQIKEDYQEVFDGPDFFSFFKNNQQYFSPGDDIHPNSEGQLIYRRMWAEKMLEVIYGSDLPSRFLSATETELFVESDSGSIASFDVNSNTIWEIHTDIEWLTISPTLGSMNRSVEISALENPTTNTRSANITISNDEFSDIIIPITQEASEPLSIPDGMIDEDDIKMYPMPANNLLSIECKSQTNIRILDLQGKIIQCFEEVNNIEIDISSLQSGIYLIRLSNTTKTITKKILIN